MAVAHGRTGKKGAAYQQLVNAYLATPTPELDAASDAAYNEMLVQTELLADSLDRFAATILETIKQIKLELNQFNTTADDALKN